MIKKALTLPLVCAALLQFGARPASPTAASPLFAQAATQEFTTVEVEGWDFSSFDVKIKEAVSRAEAPGAGERERLAAASALAARADFFWTAGMPPFYKYALGDYRHVLRFQPDNAEARERVDTIVGIYESMSRPVPPNGEAKSGGRYLVEIFKTVPKRIAFETGKPYDEGGRVSGVVAYVYEFQVRARQRLSVRLKSDDAVFDLRAAGAGDAPPLVNGAKSRDFVLPSAGEYMIRVYSRKGEAGYELKAELK
jgi:hypothetical protein